MERPFLWSRTAIFPASDHPSPNKALSPLQDKFSPTLSLGSSLLWTLSFCVKESFPRRFSILSPLEEQQAGQQLLAPSEDEHSELVHCVPPNPEWCLNRLSLWMGKLSPGSASQMAGYSERRESGRWMWSESCSVPTDTSETFRSCAHVSSSHIKACEGLLMSPFRAHGTVSLSPV